MTGILNILAGSISSAIKDGYFNLVSLLLPGNGTNGAQNNTFLDSSSNNFTITRNGNTTQGTFSPFSQTGWSGYFNGTTDYINSPSNAGFTLGTGDFSISFWVFPTKSSTATTGMVGIGGAATGQFAIFSNFPGGTTDNIVINATNGTKIVTTGTLILNAWNHIALSRASGTLSVYLNGTRVANSAFSDNLTESICSIGRTYHNLSQEYFTGYFSDVRIVKGSALYSGTTITVPTAFSTAVTNTQYLVLQDNRFRDASSNNFAITIGGTPSVQAFSPFSPTAAYSAATNGGSAYIDGTGDWLTITETSSQFTFGTGDYEYSFWVYPSDTSTTQRTLFGRTINGNTAFPYIYLVGTSRVVGVYYSSLIVSGTTAIRPFEWTYIVVSRVSGTTRIFVNGVQEGSASDTTSLISPTSVIVGNNGTTADLGFPGYIAGARIRKGSGSTSVTVPTAPPTAITNTQLLLNFTNAGITDATAKNDLETVGNAQISTTQSKFGGSSMYFDGNGDYLVPNSGTTDLFAFGTGDFTIEMWVYAASVSAVSLYDSRPTATNGNYLQIAIVSGQLVLGLNNAAILQAGTISTNTWTHIAVSRSGTSLRGFVNGTQVGSTITNSTSLLNAAQRPVIGTNGNTVAVDNFNGYIDDLRVTKGYARYTSNFTAPTAAFPTQ